MLQFYMLAIVGNAQVSMHKCQWAVHMRLRIDTCAFPTIACTEAAPGHRHTSATRAYALAHVRCLCMCVCVLTPVHRHLCVSFIIYMKICNSLTNYSIQYIIHYEYVVQYRSMVRPVFPKFTSFRGAVWCNGAGDSSNDCYVRV